jgi:ubiquinone/menaquinone biosynthesis C-methylase UbiE
VKAARKKAAADFYDGYHKASDQDGPEHPIRRKSHRLFLQWLGELAPEPGARMLDLSCGLGYFLKAAREHDPSLRLEGLDHSAYAVREAQARVPQAKVRRGDALKQPYPDGRFDALTCIGSLEHYPDPEQGLSEIHRVLKPGGKALIYVPNLFFLGYILLVWRSGETPHEAGQNEYERFETRQGWEDLLKRHGFTITKVTKHNEMYATNRVPRLLRWLYALFIERWVPLNLSYCFGFYVVKEAQAAARPR